MLNSTEIEQMIKEKKEKFIQIQNEIEPLIVERHNLELKAMEIGEPIRLGRKALSRLRLEIDMLNDDKWIALRRESGRI